MLYKEMPRFGLPVVQAKDISRDYVRLQADVVVVGSGAGGAVMAYELAKSGRSVIVLEAGAYVPSQNFTEQLGESMKSMYQDQGGQINASGDLVLLQGSCVGGSTVINATVAFRAPDKVLKQWGEEFGLKNLSPELLAPYYQQVEDRLSVHMNEPHEINECANKVVRGCEELGWSWKPLSRNVKQCALTGFCLAGCPSDRKQSMLVTYLPWAAAEGAKIYANTHVDQIVVADGRATGVDARVMDPATGKKVADLHVDAQVVIVAAGAVQSPMLLQRSGICNGSDQLGRNFSVHPFVSVLARYPEEVYGWRGALTGVHVDEFFDIEKGGMLLESGLAGPESLLAQGSMGSADSHIRFMQDYKRMAALNLFVHDKGHGRVRWVGDTSKGHKSIEWNLSSKEFEHFKTGIKHAARIFFASGADKVYLPTFEPIEVNSVFELDHKVDSIGYGGLGLYTFRVMSVHPQGTCRMGLNAWESVVDPYGETHDIKSLFVADASLFPSELMVNPQLTIYALASYIADHIIKREKNYFLSM